MTEPTYTYKDTAERLAVEAERHLSALDNLLAEREEAICALDPDLRPAARLDRVRALGAALVERAQPDDAAIADLAAKARKLAEAVDPRRARLLAGFDAKNATADATQRSAWTSRAASASDHALLDLARHVAETGQLAAAGVIEAEAQRRLSTAGGLSEHARQVLDEVLKAVATVEPADATATRAAAARVETAARNARELLRQLRGARPSALHLIGEGIRARRAGAA